MTRLVADSLTVRRGGRAVVKSVSFIAGAGEFIAVIGPNGAGKSTLLSVLAGLVKPASGTVTLDGAPLACLSGPQLAARRAWLPQNPRLDWPISVERLVALGLTPRLPAVGGLPSAFAPAITRALELCDLADRRHQAATTLSGGEFARAMLARAMVGQPDLLIVDEPIAGLDPGHAMDTARRLAAYAAGGRLVIASLHDLTLVARHATRVVALKAGQLAGEGALSGAMIRAVFDVEAQIRGSGPAGTVDILAP